MSDFAKVKMFLLDLNYEITKEDEESTLFIINAEEKGVSNMVIDCENNLIIIEQSIFSVKADSLEIYKALLQINRTMIHGAYALTEDNVVVYRDTLELENLDLNELEASINALSVSLAENANNFISFSKGETAVA